METETTAVIIGLTVGAVVLVIIVYACISMMIPEEDMPIKKGGKGGSKGGSAGGSKGGTKGTSKGPTQLTFAV